MILQVLIDLNGDAFQEHRSFEVARILRILSNSVASYGLDPYMTPTKLIDMNGNTCGEVEVIGTKEKVNASKS